MTTTDVHPDQATVDAALTTPTTVHWLTRDWQTRDARPACMTDVPPGTIVTDDFDLLDRADNPCLSCVLAAAAAGNRVGKGPKWTDLFGIDPDFPKPAPAPFDPFADRLLPDDLRAAVADVYATEAVLRRRVATATYYAALVWLLILPGIVAAHPEPLRQVGAYGIGEIGIMAVTLAAVASLLWHAPRKADQ